MKRKHKKPITINPFTGKSNEVIVRQGMASQTSDAYGAVDRRDESKTVLRDKQHHLYFKLKLIENWIYEKKHRKFFSDSEPTIKQLEVQRHNMKHEYNRVSKLLKESK
jgi:hypothetical protein